MKITLAQINCIVGDFDGNVSKIIAAIDTAKKENSDIVCFSELVTCGYPPRDFLEFDDFIIQAEKAINTIKKATIGIAAVVGSPTRNPVPEGKDLFNSAYFLADGKILHIQHKALLPTYDVFDEYRYFEPASTFNTVKYKGKNIALSICEDIWNIGNENPLYTICPLDEMDNFDFILNLSASPFSHSHPKTRQFIGKENVLRYGVPMFYTNHVGAQTELIFDGGSLVFSPNGNIYDTMPNFEECIRTYNLEEVVKGLKNNNFIPNKFELTERAIITGIKDYFEKLGFSKAIIGLSGGIDSALTTYFASRALGSKNVKCILMPSQFSTGHSVKDAEDLCNNLGISYEIIAIKPIYKQYLKTLNPYFEGLPFNVTEENIQARIRGMLLMAMSNKFGSILLNTSNKSEMAVGYGTLYGDLAGGISVIGDLYKTEVFSICKYINRTNELIPWNTIFKPPSAELRPDQKDSDSLPDYQILDTILFEYIENQKGPKEIKKMGFDSDLVDRILKMVNRNEFKRYQTAPILRLSSKAFGMGRKMPIVGCYLQ